MDKMHVNNRRYLMVDLRGKASRVQGPGAASSSHKWFLEEKITVGF